MGIHTEASAATADGKYLVRDVSPTSMLILIV